LNVFIPKIQTKSKQLNKILWILETTGSQDAADLRTEIDTEYRLLFHDKETYDQLVKWDKDGSITYPHLNRQLDILIRQFKQNLIEPQLLKESAEKESELLLSYANFRPVIEGKALTENDIKEVLKVENGPEFRKKVWSASKLIGDVLAPQILKVVKLRN